MNIIKGIYETHLQVTDLERSIEFYKLLGLELGLHIKEGNPAAFFWVVPNEERQMLGLWHASKEHFRTGHMAFRVSEEDIRTAKEWLTERGIEVWAVAGKDGSEPIVHAWMPAASIYFKDPDGNEIEFATDLTKPNKDINHVVTLSEWDSLQNCD